jgi:flagellar hook-length control protein FliK
MSIAPALPPPTSLPPPTGAAPPGAPPGATPFHSALNEELARTAPAEGQQTEGQKKAGEADAEAGRAPSRAHGHQGAKRGRLSTVVPALPGASPSEPAVPVEAVAAPVTGLPPATGTPDSAESNAAPPHMPVPAATASAGVLSPGGTPAEPAAVPAEAPSDGPPTPTTVSRPLASPAPDPVSPSPAPAPTPVQASPEIASGEQPADGGSTPPAPPSAPAPGQAGLGIHVSGRAPRAAGLSPLDTALDRDDVRTQAPGSAQPSEAQEVIARVASAPATAETTPDTARTATPSTATSAPAAPATGAAAVPTDPLAVPAQPAAAQAADSPSSGAPLLTSGVGMQEMIESIHATIELAARQGVSQARIALQPAELGEIRIHLTQTGDGLLARVTAETPAAAEALAGARSELHQSLSTLGTSLLRLDINSFAQPEGRPGQGAGDASGSGSSRSGATTGRGGTIDQLQATEAADAAAPATGPALGELVDVLA